MGEMAMIGRKATPIQVGDRFVRNGDLFGKTWEVSRVWEPVFGIPHVRLVSVERWSETRIISVATLSGREFYRPYQAPSN